MARHEDHAPVEVVDLMLWREAQTMLGRHAEAGDDGACVWCGRRWPCPPRHLAERAEAASYRPWPESEPEPVAESPRPGLHPLPRSRAEIRRGDIAALYD